MKKILFGICLLSAALVAFKPAGELAIGAALPKADVTLKDISGKEVTLKSVMKPKGLLVMFSCNTCPYVIKNQARTKEVCTYAEQNGLGVIVLNSNEAQRTTDDSFADMQAYAKAQGYNWSYAVDANSELADAFGATRTPECYLFDKDGKLEYHGAIDDSPNDAAAVKAQYLKTAIDEINAGKEVTVKTSRSVGCAIKRKG
jgi:peroxiredoxin